MNEIQEQITAIIEETNAIQSLMQRIMKEGEHYGVIPGVSKPVLLLPGAEKLLRTFRLSMSIVEERVREDGAHREYEFRIAIHSLNTGALIGEGVGTATTKETKYAYTWKEEDAGSIPPDYSEKKATYKQEGYYAVKRDNEWRWIRRIRVETNPADYYNTVRKIAKKRAFIDAVKTTLGVSDMFTQDLEELQLDEIPKPEDSTEPVKPLKLPNSKIWQSFSQEVFQTWKKIAKEPMMEAPVQDLNIIRKRIESVGFKTEEVDWMFQKLFPGMNITFGLTKALLSALGLGKGQVPFWERIEELQKFMREGEDGSES